MLRELQIINFATIKKQTVSFAPGLNIISGDSGAGKSILLHAIELALGARPRPHLLREGTDTAEVQALFSFENLTAQQRARLPEIIEGDELAIVRTIAAGGKGEVYLNGRLSTVGMLQQVVGALVSICGQNEHVQLLEPSYHRELLDGFMLLTPANREVLPRFAEQYKHWRGLADKYTELKNKSENNLLRQAELEFVVSELSKLGIVPGMRIKLEEQIKLSSNQERIRDITGKLKADLVSDGGVFAQLGQLAQRVRELEKINSVLATPLGCELSLADEALGKFERQLGTIANQIEVDESDVESLREKLSELARVERKFRTDETGLLRLLAQAQEELLSVDSDQLLAKLEKEVQAAQTDLKIAAANLSSARGQSAEKLSKLARTNLADVGMSGTTIKVALEPTAQIVATGAESVEFLVAHGASAPKPLRQIASGGELSRITLILKSALREKAGVNVLVFDEIDSGISGAVARAVGEKLKALAADSQVICITHLPQVASLADQHLKVTKSLGQQVESIVDVLSGDRQVEEIARMLAGHQVTKASLASARELMRVTN